MWRSRLQLPCAPPTPPPSLSTSSQANVLEGYADEDTAIQMPGFCHVEREITKDPQYDSFTIALREGQRL